MTSKKGNSTRTDTWKNLHRDRLGVWRLSIQVRVVFYSYGNVCGSPGMAGVIGTSYYYNTFIVLFAMENNKRFTHITSWVIETRNNDCKVGWLCKAKKGEFLVAHSYPILQLSFLLSIINAIMCMPLLLFSIVNESIHNIYKVTIPLPRLIGMDNLS